MGRSVWPGAGVPDHPSPQICDNAHRWALHATPEARTVLNTYTRARTLDHPAKAHKEDNPKQHVPGSSRGGRTRCRSSRSRQGAATRDTGSGKTAPARSKSAFAHLPRRHRRGGREPVPIGSSGGDAAKRRGRHRRHPHRAMTRTKHARSSCSEARLGAYRSGDPWVRPAGVGLDFRRRDLGCEFSSDCRFFVFQEAVIGALRLDRPCLCGELLLARAEETQAPPKSPAARVVRATCSECRGVGEQGAISAYTGRPKGVHEHFGRGYEYIVSGQQYREYTADAYLK